MASISSILPNISFKDEGFVEFKCRCPTRVLVAPFRIRAGAMPICFHWHCFQWNHFQMYNLRRHFFSALIDFLFFMCSGRSCVCAKRAFVRMRACFCEHALKWARRCDFLSSVFLRTCVRRRLLSVCVSKIFFSWSLVRSLVERCLGQLDLFPSIFFLYTLIS